MTANRNARRAVAALIACLVFSACGGIRSEANDSLQSAQPPTSPISMATDSLEKMNLPADSTAVVPSNSSVLELSASALAGFASEGSLSLLLEEFVFPERIDLNSGDETVEVTSQTGLTFTLRKVDDSWTFGGGAVIDELTVDGQHILVVDGLFQ